MVEATLPFLTRHVRGLVEFQRLTGCRPGEACALRGCDLDTGARVWLFRPAAHKTTYRGKTRVIAVGRQAQLVLKDFPTPDPAAYVFSPALAVEEFYRQRAAVRQTRLYPSHAARNNRQRVAVCKRSPSKLYTAHSYGHAVERACDRAFPPSGELARLPGETTDGWWQRLTDDQRVAVKAWRKVHRWQPNQLRHSFATRIRRLYGLEAAQVLLGHARADVTQVYAERNHSLAEEIMAAHG